ncbi:hypothetical protein ALC56_01806, partial [Trachymyrmex septentrionalis]
IKMSMEIDEKQKSEKMQMLMNIIDELYMTSFNITNQIYSLYVESKKVQSEIKALESRNENHSSQNYLSESTNKSSDESNMSHNDESTFAALSKNKRLLELEIELKSSTIAILQQQIYIKLLHEEKIENLHNRLMMHNKKETLLIF